jgi:hypothetical protein
MSSTQTEKATKTPTGQTVDLKLEVAVIPVGAFHLEGARR